MSCSSDIYLNSTNSNQIKHTHAHTQSLKTISQTKVKNKPKQSNQSHHNCCQSLEKKIQKNRMYVYKMAQGNSNIIQMN